MEGENEKPENPPPHIFSRLKSMKSMKVDGENTNERRDTLIGTIEKRRESVMSVNMQCENANFTRRVSINTDAIKAAMEKRRASTKRKTNLLSKFLDFLSPEIIQALDEDEEKKKKYEIALNGWKKVRRVLTLMKYDKTNTLSGNNYSNYSKRSTLTYHDLILTPKSKFRHYWQRLISFLLLYSILIIPLRYFFEEINNIYFIVLDVIMDILFFLDIILNFFFAYVKKTKIIKTFNLIAMQYLKSWFLPDLICLVPYYFTEQNSSVYAIRFFRVLRIGTVMRGYEEFWLDTLSKVSSNLNFIKSLTSILNFVLLLGLIGQFLSCVWYELGKGEGGWVRLQLYQYDDNGEVVYAPSRSTKYITSIYWVYTTLTTAGYGDYYGRTKTEQVFTMAVQFMGVFVFAYLMGNINVLVQKLDDDHLEFMENEGEALDQWLIKIDRANPNRNLPSPFIKDLRERFFNYWQKDHTTIIKDFCFLQQLPIPLKTDLIEHLFGDFIKEYSVFFKGLETLFIHDLVVHLEPRKFPQKREIIQVGSTSDGVFFITKGFVTLGSKEGVTTYLDLPSYSFFGEHLVLFNLRSSISFLAHHGDVECMLLPREKLLELCELYPYSYKLLKYKAFLRRKHFREVKVRVEAEIAESFRNRGRLLTNLRNNIRKETNSERMNSTSIARTPIPEKIVEEIDRMEQVEEEYTEKEEKNPASNKEFYNLNNGTDKYEIPLESEKMDDLIEDMEKKNKLIEFAKKINDEIDAVSRMISSMNTEFKKKFKLLKADMEFILNYEVAET